MLDITYFGARVGLDKGRLGPDTQTESLVLFSSIKNSKYKYIWAYTSRKESYTPYVAYRRKIHYRCTFHLK